MKRPSFQFYPGDWRSNANLRRCTHAERGIWMDLLCLMHDGEQYGVLRWPLKEIAQAVGCRVSELRSLVAKGVLKGADQGETVEPFIYKPRHGGQEGQPVTLIHRQQGPVWYSSRMLTDEHIRIRRGASTRIDGDGNLPPKLAPKDTPKPPFGDDLGGGLGDGPSSSSSSSSSTSKNPDGGGGSNATISARASPVAAAAGPADPVLDLTGDPTPPLAGAVHLRAVELTALGRQRGCAYQASDPRVREWAERGITDAQLLTAIDRAQERRHAAASAQPINSGFIETMLADVMAGSSSGVRNGPSTRFSPHAANARLLRELEAGVAATAVDPPPAQPAYVDVRSALPAAFPRRDVDD